MIVKNAYIKNISRFFLSHSIRMGTDELDNRLQHSMMLSAILKYIKDIENDSIQNKRTGLKKKELVIKLIQNNMPALYQENTILIDIMIDTFILVSNNPSILHADLSCSTPFYLCCGC